MYDDAWSPWNIHICECNVGPVLSRSINVDETVSFCYLDHSSSVVLLAYRRAIWCRLHAYYSNYLWCWVFKH